MTDKVLRCEVERTDGSRKSYGPSVIQVGSSTVTITPKSGGPTEVIPLSQIKDIKLEEGDIIIQGGVPKFTKR